MKPISAGVLTGLLVAVVGCSLTQSRIRKDEVLPLIGGKERAIAPKRVALKMMIASRPLNDPALNESLWRVADVQVIQAEERQSWQSNGLRIGRVAGDLPPDVQAVLDAPPPHKVEPAIFAPPAGESTLVDLAPLTPKVDLLMNRDGKVAGKGYTEARGRLRVTPDYDGSNGITLRIVPELHHGPMKRGWSVAPGGAGSFEPQQFILRDGQQEDSLRELTVRLTLLPGQLAVASCVPNRTGSLGAFLFTEPEANSDRLLQKCLFIWANRADQVEAPAPK